MQPYVIFYSESFFIKTFKTKNLCSLYWFYVFNEIWSHPLHHDNHVWKIIFSRKQNISQWEHYSMNYVIYDHDDKVGYRSLVYPCYYIITRWVTSDMIIAG